METARLARVTGLLYLVLAALGMFSPLVLDSLVVPGDAQATADNVRGSRWLFAGSLVTWLAIGAVDVAISVTFYLLLRPVSHMLSLLAAALDTFSVGFLVALVLFGAHLLALGFLLHRSRTVESAKVE